MQPLPDNPRRRFLRSSARLGVAGILAAIGWTATRGKPGSNRSDHECIADGVCRPCSRRRRCILPQAQYWRRAREEHDSRGES